MARKTRQNPPGPGAIVALPLPDGKFAFAKVYNDHNLGVYDFVSDKIEAADVVREHKIAFHQGVVDTALKSGEWAVIGMEPFATDDDAWPPVRAAGIIPGRPIDPLMVGLNHKGKSRRAKLDEVLGLEVSVFYPTPKHFINMVVDRLVKGNHDKYRVSP